MFAHLTNADATSGTIATLLFVSDQRPKALDIADD
jgi:hypothetical protein